MEFTLADQTVYFLFSLIFGVLLSTLYDIVKVLRLNYCVRMWQIIVLDLLYMFVCAILTVLFAMPFNNGYVRYFVLFGEIIGFVVYRFTLGEIVLKIYLTILRLLSAVFKKSLKITGFFLNKVLKVNGFVVYNVRVLLYKAQNIVLKKKRKCYEQKKGS